MKSTVINMIFCICSEFCSFQFVLRFWFKRCLSKVSVINALNRTKMTLEFWNLPSLKISQKLSDLKSRIFSSTFSVLFTAIIDFLSLYVEYIWKCWNSTVSLRLHWRVRGSQSFFKTAYLSHFSDFASLKNLSEFYFCSAQQIRMRNCEPYIEVSKETLNPHYLLQ